MLGIAPSDEGRQAIMDGTVGSVRIEGTAERVPVVASSPTGQGF